jgi:orotate phosphoribosyltransferase
VVAGGETAGIPFAAFLAALAKKSMIYVRKQPKGFGRMAQIEGDLKPGKRVLLVEDLATDGGSKLVFIDALKKAEAKVTDCFVDLPLRHLPAERRDAGRGRREAPCARHLVGRAGGGAQKGKYFDERGLAETSAFLEAPEQWSANHGGRPPAPRLTAR